MWECPARCPARCPKMSRNVRMSRKMSRKMSPRGPEMWECPARCPARCPQHVPKCENVPQNVPHLQDVPQNVSVIPLTVSFVKTCIFKPWPKFPPVCPASIPSTKSKSRGVQILPRICIPQSDENDKADPPHKKLGNSICYVLLGFLGS